MLNFLHVLFFIKRVKNCKNRSFLIGRFKRGQVSSPFLVASHSISCYSSTYDRFCEYITYASKQMHKDILYELLERFFREKLIFSL